MLRSFPVLDGVLDKPIGSGKVPLTAKRHSTSPESGYRFQDNDMLKNKGLERGSDLSERKAF
jgi:hypothetical protein